MKKEEVGAFAESDNPLADPEAKAKKDDTAVFAPAKKTWTATLGRLCCGLIIAGLFIFLVLAVVGIFIEDEKCTNTPECDSSWVGDGACDGQCFLADCDFDGGDCDGVPDPLACYELGCDTFDMGQDFCAGGCNIEECAFSLGDCLPEECGTEGCDFLWVGDRVCDSVCQNLDCFFDGEDCTNSSTFAVADPAACEATGCNLFYLGDGTCDIDCYTEACQFDGTDCDSVPTECLENTFCVTEFLGDGFCDLACNNDACNQDNGDCSSSEYEYEY